MKNANLEEKIDDLSLKIGKMRLKVKERRKIRKIGIIKMIIYCAIY